MLKVAAPVAVLLAFALFGRANAAAPPAADVRVVVQDLGEFRIRLYRDDVPNAVSLFLALVAKDAYDGLQFHRILPRLVIQTGDPNTRDDDPANDGQGAPPWRLPAEAAHHTHVRGTVSLAWRGTSPDSAGMEWFVCLADNPALDTRGTPIGEVIEGWNVVEKIAQQSTDRDGKPYKSIKIADMRLEPVGGSAKADSAAGSTAR